MRWVVVALALAGCDRVFDVRQVDLIDAAIDAAPFDASTCPARYAFTLPLHPQSRYAIDVTAHTVFEHSEMCEVDLPGATQLAAPTSGQDVLDMIAMLGAGGFTGVYLLGAVQQGRDGDPSDGWLRFTGGALPGRWGFNEPNDGKPTDNNTPQPETGTEQFAALWPDMTPSGLLDVGGPTPAGAICACDGAAFDPVARVVFEGEAP